MNPKIRSPFISWLLTVVTGGIYLLFWVWLVTSELNSAEKRKVFPIYTWRIIALILFCLATVGFVIAAQAKDPFLFLVVAVCLLGFFLYIQISIGNYIKMKYAQLNAGARFSNVLSIILFWLVANTGVAYMQLGINRVIRHEQSRS